MRVVVVGCGVTRELLGWCAWWLWACALVPRGGVGDAHMPLGRTFCRLGATGGASVCVWLSGVFLSRCRRFYGFRVPGGFVAAARWGAGVRVGGRKRFVVRFIPHYPSVLGVGG